MPTHGTRKEILARFLQEVWNEGSLEAVERYVAPRYTVHHDPGDPWDGKQLSLEEYKDRLVRSRAPFPDERFTIRELFEDGGAVVATWVWTGVHTGDLAGFPASGKAISMSGITVYYFDGDRVTGHWQVVDRLGVFRQLQHLAQAAR